MNPEVISLGQYSLPFLLSLFLGLLFNRVPNIPNDLKPFIAALCGCLIGVAAMFYNLDGPYTFKIWADYLLGGLTAGMASTGVYEMSKSAPVKKNQV